MDFLTFCKKFRCGRQCARSQAQDRQNPPPKYAHPSRPNRAQIGCHNGRGFMLVEVKPGMIGHYLGGHAITYKPVKHGHVSKNFHSRFMQLV